MRFFLLPSERVQKGRENANYDKQVRTHFLAAKYVRTNYLKWVFSRPFLMKLLWKNQSLLFSFLEKQLCTARARILAGTFPLSSVREQSFNFGETSPSDEH